MNIKTKLEQFGSLLGVESQLQGMSFEQWQEWHKAEGEKSAAAMLAENRQNYLNSLMRDSDVKLEGKTFATFKATEDWQHSLVGACGNFADNVFTGGDKSLILCGEYGTGKTHLGAAIMAHIASERSTVTFLAKQWSNVIRKIFSGSNHDFSVDGFIRKLSSVDVLLIDEVGANENKLTDGQLSTMGEIIRNRGNKGKITILTTNYDLDEVQDRLGYFVVNGLRESGLTVLQIEKGKNRNQRKPVAAYNF
jgi:DNA replication protein DnaC